MTLPSLNPAAVPFPPKAASPTISNDSSSTESTQASSAGTGATYSSFSATSTYSPSFSSQVDPRIPDHKIRQFGSGWKSSIPSTLLEPHAPPATTVPITRTRSPSLPILPSQGLVAAHCHEIADSFGNLGYGAHSYQPRPYPAQLAEKPTEPTFKPPTNPLLTHHASVPVLSTIPRRLPGQVRFTDDLAEDRLDDLTPLAYDARRLASKSMPAIIPSVKGKNVYIASVSPDLTTEELEKTAGLFGEVLMGRIQKVGDSASYLNLGSQLWESPPRHCAFVLFETVAQASSFINFLRTKGMACDYAKEDFQTEWKSREDRSSSNLYIQGLPLTVQAAHIIDLLAPYGSVVSLKVLDSKGVRRGPVMARLENREQADAAIKGLNNCIYGKDGIMLQVRIADSEGQKDFKRKANLIGGLDHFSSIRDDSRRASMPVGDARTTAEASRLAEIEAQKRRYLDQIRLLEAQEEQITVQQAYTRRRLDLSHTLFDGAAESFSPLHITFPTAPTISSTPSMTERSWSFASGASGYSGYNSPSIWSNEGPITPLKPSTHGHHSNHLHHARSSPELSMKLDTPAKLLWPDWLASQ